MRVTGHLLLQAAALLPLVSTAMAAAMAAAKTQPEPQPLSNCPPREVSDKERRTIFFDFVNDFLVRRNYGNATWDKYVAEDYIQHNPYALSGRDAVKAFFSQITPGRTKISILSKGIDHDFAYIHWRMDTVNATQPTAGVDIYRFNGSCIQEHWDVMQQRPENAINPLAMF